MKLRDHPKMMHMGSSLWPPEWGGTHGRRPPPEEGILRSVKNIGAPRGNLSVAMEFNGELFRGSLLLDDAAFREHVYELLKRNIGKTTREVGDLDIESK